MAQFGVYLPNVAWESLPEPRHLVDYAVTAESLGFDSVWVEDRLLHKRVKILEALTALTFVASRTRKIKLGTCVLLVNLRNPLILAKAIASLDYLSGGRVVLGVSLGGSMEEYGAAGVSMKTRVTRFKETLEIMQALWGRRGLDGQHELFQPSHIAMEPGPAQSRIPIWIGGKAEPVFHRAATLGDGWLASSMTSASDFIQDWSKVRRHAVAAGRELESLTPAKFCYIHIDDDTERAFSVLNSRLPPYYGFQYDVERFALYGPPGRCVEQANKLLKAGVQVLIFSPVTHDLGQLERLAQEVLPPLREARGDRAVR